MTEEKKKCFRCNKKKSLVEFAKDRQKKDHLRPYCRRCESINKETFDLKQKMKKLGYRLCGICKRWKKLEVFGRAYGREKYGKSTQCRSCKTKYSSEYYHEHQEYLRELRRKWTRTHPEYQKEYNKKHADKLRPKWVVISAARRSRIKGDGHTYRLSQWIKIREYYSPTGKCLACKKKHKLTVDHVIPVIRGGKNSVENLQPLCQRCNSVKGIMIIDYRLDLGRYAKGLT